MENFDQYDLSSRKGPSPVSDHLGFTFWVVKRVKPPIMGGFTHHLFWHLLIFIKVYLFLAPFSFGPFFTTLPNSPIFVQFLPLTKLEFCNDFALFSC